MTPPVLAGSIEEGGPAKVLSDVEALRTSGELRFKSGDRRGVLRVIAGQLAEEQTETESGEDPVELFLSLEDGTFALVQRLPPLSVSQGDDRARTGSLAIHVPADLMNYCERAGLTGVLRMAKDSRFAEAVYDRGELVAIRVDGSEDADLHDVFGWEDGTFEVEASERVPEVEADLSDLVSERPQDPLADPPPPGREPTGKFLKVVEVALGSILEEREKRRSPTRTSPPQDPRPKTRSDAPQGNVRRREPTVKIIYLGDAEPMAISEDTSTRHVAGGERVDALPEATEDRRSSEHESAGGEGPARGSAMTGEAKQPAPSEKPSASKGEAGKDERASTEGRASAPPRDSAGPTGAEAVEPAESEAAEDEAEPTPTLQMVSQVVGWVVLLLVLSFVALALLANLPPL